jgi:hypothetical protein
MPAAIRLARLRRCVTELLAAARRGDVEPIETELAALCHVCIERGAIDSARAIARYITDNQAVEEGRARRSVH